VFTTGVVIASVAILLPSLSPAWTARLASEPSRLRSACTTADGCATLALGIALTSAAAEAAAAGGAVRPRRGDDLRDADVAAVAAGLGAELAHEVWRETEDCGGGEGAARLGGEDHLRRERDGGHG